MTTRIPHFIAGQIQPGTSGRTAPVFNPATGSVRAQVDLASVEEVDTAIAAAARAARSWRQAPLSHRAAVLFAMRQQLADRADDLARIITSEHGKVHADALGEISRGLENVEFAAGLQQLLKGDYSEQAATGVDVYSIRQPLGVVVGITPFNFPAMVPLWMCANAIACGNAFVLKPSEKDPSAAMFIAELWQAAGLPDGVFTVLHGDAETVERLLCHDEVAAISFVGSTPIARHIYEVGTSHGKRVQALGGAKNHALVLPDADVDLAADAIVSAAYGSAGERCMALSVAVVVGEVADALVEAISVRLPALVIGPGDDATTDMGPLITAEHRDRVASYIDTGEREGARVVVDGRSTKVPEQGFFLGLTLLDHVSQEMSVYRDEIFGPILAVVRVETYDEALELINSHQYANGTAIFTRDGAAARRFQFEVNVGMVGINIPIPVPVSYYSFGGWKGSLFGDTHMYGPEGINFFTRAKVVTSRWPTPAKSSLDLRFPTNR